MELALWETLWVNCALGTFFALPNIPIVSTDIEDQFLQVDEDSTSRQDHETQTNGFSDSENESFSQETCQLIDEDGDENLTANTKNNNEIECKKDVNIELQNISSTSDSNSVWSLTENNQNETIKVIENKAKKIKSFQRNRYNREEYRCTICPYTCTTERAFLRHLRSHSEGEENEESKTNNTEMIPRLSCPVCGKDRNGEPALNKHMQKHRDLNKNFCCDICSFKTVQLKKLIQHRRMHTGERPHLCPHCAYRAARRDNLRSHVRRVHKMDNLTCDTFNPRGMLLVPTTVKNANEKTENEVKCNENEQNVKQQVVEN